MSLKKVLIVIVFVFVGFWLFRDPTGLAAAAQGLVAAGWELLARLFAAVMAFIAAL